MANPPGNPPAIDALLAGWERGLPQGSLRAWGTTAEGDTLFSHHDPSLPLPLMGVSRMVTLAMVLRDIDRGALAIDTPISDVLPQSMTSGLCVVKGKDYSDTITVGHLLAHQSGIADHFDPPGKNIRSMASQVRTKDRAWSTAEALEIARHYAGLFPPGTNKHPSFSSANYLILGEALRETTGMSLAELVKLRVASPLNIPTTYLFGPEYYDTYFTYPPATWGDTTLRIPLALASAGADGGIVSTPRDAAVLLRGFWQGKLFDTSWKEQLIQAPESLGLHASSGKTGQIIAEAGFTGIAAGINTTTGDVGFIATHQRQKAAISFRRLGQLMGSV